MKSPGSELEVDEGQSPFGTFGDVEGGYLKLCAEWHVVRAQQRVNWAQGDLESCCMKLLISTWGRLSG